MGQISLEKTFLLAAYAEVILYGTFVCIFGAAMYLYFSPAYKKGREDSHVNVMIGISAVMYLISTAHVAVNCYRLLLGYADHRLTPGGPAMFIGNLRPWHHIFKDALYATQENLGSVAAIYRCWVLWGRDLRVIILPTLLLVMNMIAGYIICGTYPSVDSSSTVFSPKLNSWIRTFYSIAVALNIITTGLMSYRIWVTHQNSTQYQVGKGRLMSVMRILIESAALRLMVEILLLALYCTNSNAQYILLECITPMVGITFNMITVRIKLQSLNDSGMKTICGSSPSDAGGGGIPMRRIQVNIDKEIHDDRESAFNLGKP